MAKTESLDELIAKNAAEFADQIKAAAQMADKEEEIRIEAERQLAFIEQQTGIKLEGKHEFTVASGRADSVYDSVIIEYKNPKSPGARIGPKADSPGSKKVVEQIKNRFYDMRTAHGHDLNTMFGVGLDGNYFIFIRFRDDKWHVQEPVEVNKYSAERFLWALYNLGQKGKPFSSEYLAGDFGSESKLAQDGVRALYNAIIATDNPKAQIFFSQWKILFCEVCGYDVDNPSDKIKKLAEFYGVEHRRKFKAAELLFAVHSYYAIFMKLLASEIAAYFHKLPTPLQKMIQAGSSNALKREMEDLEAGSIFRHLNITNFLEGDLFAWYIPVWSEPIEHLVRSMVARLDDYNPGTLSEDPAGSRDLLKKLYQQLFPKSVRHDLGEYYTPDWLAEHVLNELGYVGDPDKRLLDPACGSGTFLVMAINRIRKWYDENREQTRFDEGDLCRKILSNVIGFDLNPLAVMAARTNYLIAIRDLVGHVDKVEIPIYLCDSIMTPSEYGGLFAGALGKAKTLKTAAAKFIIPTEIATHRDDVATYADQLEFCVRNAYSPQEFVERCRDEGLPISEEALHTDLYQELVKLDKANKNGVWARIIKNAFAPLFIGVVDYVAGNPPWINWESLPEDYREATAPLWQKYDLFRHKGYKAKLGGGKDDVSFLFTYVCHDCFLADSGRLGFVITQSVFKSKGGGEGFRTFQYQSSGGKVFLRPETIDDLSDLAPFEGATNRTAVLVVSKSNTPFKYPVRYVVWTGKSREPIVPENSLDEVRTKTNRQVLAAEPINSDHLTSPWLTLPEETLGGIKKILGSNTYTAYEGVNAGGLSGCFWIRVIDELKNGDLLIENLHDAGKIKVEKVQTVIEADLVYPLVRGREAWRWHSQPSAHIILANRTDKLAGLPEAELKSRWPKTFNYLKKFEGSSQHPVRGTLRGRALYKLFFKPTDPFYSMFNVGPYTVSEWKVVFKDLSEVFQAAVIGPLESGPTAKPVLADLTLRLIPINSGPEAYYLSALLNSSPSVLMLHASSVGVQTQRYHPSDLAQIRIPSFNAEDELHLELAELAKKCHLAAASRSPELSSFEAAVDISASRLWDITEGELKAIRNRSSMLTKVKYPH
jgi:hypothetical protein